MQKSMPLVGFEPIILVLECAKTIHALNCAATVIGLYYKYKNEFRQDDISFTH
jgi:hypothetical protein